MSDTNPSTDLPGYSFLEYVLEALVDDKDQLKIDQTEIGRAHV